MCWILAELGAERLVGLDPVAVRLQRLGGPAGRAPPGVALLAQDAAEQAAVQWAPRDHADTVVAAGRQQLQLDRALEEVVERLLGDQTEEAAPARGLLRLD